MCSPNSKIFCDDRVEVLFRVQVYVAGVFEIVRRRGIRSEHVLDTKLIHMLCAMRDHTMQGLGEDGLYEFRVAV